MNHEEVIINVQKCAGHALCSIIAPDVFIVNAAGKAELIGPITPENRDTVLEAIAECPAGALKMREGGKGD